MKVYINVKHHDGSRETVEQFSSTDYASIEAMRTAVATRLGSYRMTFRRAVVYPSTRCCGGWTGN